MPAIAMSVTLPRASAMIRQPSTTVRRNGSLAGQALCRDSDVTRSGYLAASHMPVAAPSDSPAASGSAGLAISAVHRGCYNDHDAPR